MDAVTYGKVAQVERKLSDIEARIRAIQTDIEKASTILKEVMEVVTVNAGETKLVTVNVELNKYELRTVSGISETSNLFSLSFYDKSIDGFKYYESIRSNNLYDLVNVPTSDKDQLGNVYFAVTNHGNTTDTITLKFSVTSLV